MLKKAYDKLLDLLIFIEANVTDDIRRDNKTREQNRREEIKGIRGLTRRQAIVARFKIAYVAAKWWGEDLLQIAVPTFVLVGLVVASWRFWTWLL